MAGLTAEQIAVLLNKDAQRRGGRTSKPKIDTNKRDYSTWFKLAHSIIDANNEPRRCENPNCTDPRDHSTYVQICAQINEGSPFMCRFCFLAGWFSSDAKE